MKTRQNPLKKFETLMERIVQAPFVFLFPSKLEPAEIRRKLERAMEDNLILQGEGRRLAPNVYDIYLSIKDHQQLSQSLSYHVNDWKTSLVEFARQRHYTLKTNPIIRIHSDSGLRTSNIRIDAELADRKHMGSSEDNTEGGVMATQALSAEQLAQLRAQFPTGQPLPGLPDVASPSAPNYGGSSPQQMPPGSQTNYPSMPPPVHVAPAMPQTWLTIRLPNAPEQTYRIEKPVINIGRQLSNDIIVEDKRVSRYHAQIKYQPDGQFAIFDLGSTNGITINNTPHQRQHTLHNGDSFTIGSYDFHFQRR
ncbi:MAG: FHA domain-containing protein [Chloroflexota bacterium]|nr:FHA domain-containing protein [Chloroflexota bacterium]